MTRVDRLDENVLPSNLPVSGQLDHLGLLAASEPDTANTTSHFRRLMLLCVGAAGHRPLALEDGSF